MGLLEGKVAIVTGAGRGIGRGEALELASHGARVVVNDLGTSVRGDGGEQRVADEVVELIEDAGGEAVANYEDISDWDAAERLVEHAVDAFGHLDVLVNNAGVLRDAVIVRMTEEEFDTVIRVHLKGTFACTHHAANYWRAEAKAGRRRDAAIVNTVSSAGLRGNPGQANYGAAKAGIAALTIITSLELGRYGVRANAIAPGGFTRMVGATVGRPEDVREVDQYQEDEEFDPMNPGNSAPMVAWLASDEALHVTGQVFRAVGSAIAYYEGWRLGDEVKTDGRWDATEIGDWVNADIFQCRAPGLRLQL